MGKKKKKNGGSKIDYLELMQLAYNQANNQKILDQISDIMTDHPQPHSKKKKMDKAEFLGEIYHNAVYATNQSIYQTDVESPVNTTSSQPVVEEKKNDSRKLYPNINFSIYKDLNKAVMEDCLIPTSFLLDPETVFPLPKIPLNSGFEPEEFLSMADTCLYYVIFTKHPFAMFLYDEYMTYFENVTDYNKDKYLFLQAGNYMLCYIIDIDQFKEFKEALSYKDLSSENSDAVCGRSVQYYAIKCAAMVIFADSIQNRCEVMDSRYMDTIRKNYTTYQNESFVNGFLKDPETKEGYTDDGKPAIEYFKFEDLWDSTAAILKTLIGYDLMDGEFIGEDDLEYIDDNSEESSDKLISTVAYEDIHDQIDKGTEYIQDNVEDVELIDDDTDIIIADPLPSDSSHVTDEPVEESNNGQTMAEKYRTTVIESDSEDMERVISITRK